MKLTFIGDSKAAGIEFSRKAKRLLSRGNDVRRDLRVCRRRPEGDQRREQGDEDERACDPGAHPHADRIARPLAGVRGLGCQPGKALRLAHSRLRGSN